MLYKDIGINIVNYLINHCNSDGVLFDEIDKKFTPKNHYAQAFFSSACLLAYKITLEQKYIVYSRKSLDIFFKTPHKKRGHLEFNNLAMLILKDQINFSEELYYDKNQKKVLDTYIKSMDFQSDREKISNNFVAMKAVCFAILYKIKKDEFFKVRSETLIREVILSWQSKDGIFYDYPSMLNSDNFASPLAYHAKMCSMLLICYEILKDEKIILAVKKGLDAICSIMLRDGNALCYGRSANSIFGYISLLYALEEFLRLDISDCKKENYQDKLARLKTYLQKFICKDGHLKVVLNKEESHKAGWDNYMHLSVYNAYSTVFLLMLALKNKKDTKINDTFYKQGINVLDNTGILRYSKNDIEMILSLNGQEVLEDNIYFCDIRYTGMQINYLKYKDKEIIGLPCAKGQDAVHKLDLVNPYFLGFAPYLILKGEKYFCKVFDNVCYNEQEYGFSVSSKGVLGTYKSKKSIYKLLYRFSPFLFSNDNKYFDKDLLENTKLLYNIYFIEKYKIFLFFTKIELEEKFKKGIINSFNARFCSSISLDNNKIVINDNISYENVYDSLDFKNCSFEIFKTESSLCKNYHFSVNRAITDTDFPYTNINVLYLEADKKQEIHYNKQENAIKIMDVKVQII